jgi:hypothetical protein
LLYCPEIDIRARRPVGGATREGVWDGQHAMALEEIAGCDRDVETAHGS